MTLGHGCRHMSPGNQTLEHLTAAVDLYMAFFNFCRVHQTLRVTPAMQAGLTDHIWTVQELLEAA